MAGFLTRLKTENPAGLFLGLGGASILIMSAGILGAIKVGGQKIATGNEPTTEVSPGDAGGSPTVDPAAEAAAQAAAQQAARSTTGTARRAGIAAKDLESTVGATRVGVTPDAIRWGLHAPKTFDGAPLPLADDPLLGVDIYLQHINQAGIHGRKIQKFFADDRYTVEGAKGASNDLLNDKQVFYVSGTLGVDQVATVAAAARDTKPAPTPYMAAGGSEADFKSIGMYQIAGSYDTHLIMLAEFLAKESAKPPCQALPGSIPANETCQPGQSIYGGRKKVAAVELDSKYISGSVESLKNAVTANGLEWVGKVGVPKFTDASNTHVYTGQCLALQQMGAQIVVPATDPLTTTNMTVTGGCEQFRWTMSNFAHDSDVALDLMQRKWTNARGLSGGCYYEEWNTALAGKCAKLKEAHDAWVAINPQASGGGSWSQDGQGGISGYQITHFWLAALKNIGPDPTREKFVAALSAYVNYNDLVTGPLTFKGVPNIAHGIDVMAVYEAQSNGKWKQISDGLVKSF
jgi:ABC-type branched-subunit amino acid transport system substrate-binding protein